MCVGVGALRVFQGLPLTKQPFPQRGKRTTLIVFEIGLLFSSIVFYVDCLLRAVPTNLQLVHFVLLAPPLLRQTC